MTVLQFRPYRVRELATSAFLANVTTKHSREFADEDLAKSKLTLEDMHGTAHDAIPLPQGAIASYLIPYWTVTGEPISDEEQYILMYRKRLKHPPLAKAQRYTQPSGEDLAAKGLPSFLPYLYPCQELTGDTIYICEGEKKTVSFIKNLQLPALGISGCNMWGDPSRRGGPHPWILEYFNIRGIKRVIIVPDGDLFKYDVCTAYGTFAHSLSQLGYDVTLLNPPGKIDDLIVEWGNEGIARLAAIPSLSPTELVQTPHSLANAYNLAFKRTREDRVTLHQHTSNIMRLLRQHPAFPKIWLNEDKNRVMLGDEEAEPDKTEMDIANHFQHNFGMEKVGSKTIQLCMRALSKENSNSPMLRYISSMIWDGVPRLDTWLTDTWGVENNAFNREVSSKWLVAACARMAVPGSKVDWIFITIGPQGTGKTSMPSILFKGNNLTLYGDHDNKDLHMLLHSALVVGFDELDSFSRKDASLLKAMITTTEDMFRPPYGASIEIFPRRFTLYGCGNRYEFLQNDPSGQRRYAIVEVPRLLDFAALESIRDQLWAEAWSRYKEGKTKWWEIEGATENAEKYELPNLLKEQIITAIQREQFAKQAATQGEFKFTMTQLFSWMNIQTKQGDPQVREAAAILKAMGFTKRQVRVQTGSYQFYFPPATVA